MKKNSDLPIFGPNGAVLNSETMSSEFRSEIESYDWKDEFRSNYKPKTWPHSAIFLMLIGCGILGYNFALLQSGGAAQSSILLNLVGVCFIGLGQGWRRIWEKRLKR